jgi:4-oxalmesaconate hydratase
MHSVKPEYVTSAWVSFINDHIARHCALYPEVFRGMCGLPQFRDTSPKNCLDELERCVKELGFVGCLLNPDPMEGDGTPPPGLADEFWYPLYEKLVELDVPALIHSASCTNAREPYTLHFINEESIAILQLVDSKVFDDFPSLKIIVAHGGGAIPYQMGRFRAWSIRSGRPDFDEQVRKLWYDTCNYSGDSLALLAKVVGADRILFGTEMPGTGSAEDPKTGRMLDDLKPVIEELGLSKEELRMIFSKNAMGLFDLGIKVGSEA